MYTSVGRNTPIYVYSSPCACDLLTQYGGVLSLIFIFPAQLPIYIYIRRLCVGVRRVQVRARVCECECTSRIQPPGKGTMKRVEEREELRRGLAMSLHGNRGGGGGGHAGARRTTPRRCTMATATATLRAPIVHTPADPD